jgi:NlpC/P60 family putative phage cell wall peptidase
VAPRYSPTWAEGGKRELLIEAAERHLLRDPDIHIGSVVIFRMREHMIAKHCGIVVTPGTFIHAIQGRGVNEEPLTEAWRRRIADVFVYPGGVT